MKNHSADSPDGSQQPRTSAVSSTLPRLDTELFRRKLAGIVDPDRQIEGGEKVEIREAVVRFGSIMAHLFGESLDRLTLWERIGSAFSTSLAKVSDDDLDRFVTLCLEHIKAEDGRVAACEPLLHMLETFAVRPREWRQAFLQYLLTHRTAAIIHARARWEKVKVKAVNL